MKSANTFAVAFAVSALLAGPALAQGTSTQGQTGAMQRSPGAMQSAPSGAADDELNAQSGTEKGGVAAKSGSRGTVGANTGTHKATGSSGSTSGTKKY